jgi:hypothetical protein
MVCWTVAWMVGEWVCRLAVEKAAMKAGLLVDGKADQLDAWMAALWGLLVSMSADPKET